MSHKSTTLVADIGGTNLRIGITNSNHNIDCLVQYTCNEYNSLAEIILDYTLQNNIAPENVNACFAIACPVDNDVLTMTNLPWQFSQKALLKQLCFNRLTFINDYTAIAFSIPLLNSSQKTKVGGGTPVPEQAISICGPGTGLGVANLVFDEQWHCISGEGGHVDFAPTNAVEIEVLSYLLTRYSHVSYEQLLSGLGIEQIYQALNFINGSEAQELKAKDISEHALASTCELCRQSLLIFCKLLGSFAGNLALTISSFGGVYIAGGIVPRFIDFLKDSEFRTAFEHKGRFSSFNQKIPTYVITESQPGILGASAYLHQQL